MKPKIFLILSIILPTLVLVCFSINNLTQITDNQTNNLRNLLGFSSIAVGNLNPAAREPGIEVFCTSVYDVPGGYCIYYSNGAYSVFSGFIANVTKEVVK